MLINRLLSLSIILSVTTLPALAQLKAPLNPAVEPFTITKGSTFSASGGSPNARPDVELESERPSSIAADILEAQRLIAANHSSSRKLNPSALIKFAIEGMLDSLDPHSSFYDATEWKELLDEQRSGYTGIGATIGNFKRGDETATYILSTFPASPAFSAQLRFGDKIVAINDENVLDKPTDVVRDKIRGASGTTFRLTVERAATRENEVVEIKRGRVPQPSIPDAYILRPGIGYIQLSDGFTYTTASEFDLALRNLKKQGMRSLVLDLRGNGGGIVDQAVKIAERFLPAGTLILTQRGRSRVDNRTWRSTNTNPEQMPLVVLVDEDTASASEIVAAAFQDDDRALIVGERTFGKGLVQSVLDLPAKTGLTLTTARYLTPSGRSIQREYSKIDRYDYFNHKTATTAIGNPYFEARTTTDRPVFGGDGIQPDELVKSDPLTQEQVSLIDAIFVFAREVASGRTEGLDDYKIRRAQFGIRIAKTDFPYYEPLTSQFLQFARLNNIPASVLNREASFIRLRLRYYLVMASFGATSASQVLTEDDPQVAKAVELFPRSAQLADLARKTRSRQK